MHHMAGIPRAGARRHDMANDADWVADVRRWYFSTAQKPPASVSANDIEADAVGYEAAHPSLEARHWPETGNGGLDLK